jgi:hypothetical protein
MYSKGCQRLTFLILLLAIVIGFKAFPQSNRLLIVRFANPEYDFATQTYCLDVEFQSDTIDVLLYQMNVRFFYPDNILEFQSLGEFQGGYGPVSPNPPVITTYSDTSGQALFGFDGAAEYVNGAVQLLDLGNLVYISNTGWTKLFNICFHVDDPNALYTDDFWPSVIWDLEENPADGGFIGGSGGVVMTVIGTLNPLTSYPAKENVVQFNWQYDGIPGIPYGYPVNNISISTRVAPEIKIDSTLTFSYDYVTLAIKAWHFFDISTMTLTLDYNSSVLDYCCCTPDPGIAANFSVEIPYAGRLQINSSEIATDYSDGSALFYLTFKFPGGTSALSWYDNGTSCQFVNSNTGLPLYDSPISAFYIPGNVSNGQYIWTGVTSANWNTSTNWQNNFIPGRFSDVIINSSPMPANWPTYTGNFTLGEQCKNIKLNGSAQLIITGSLAINPGDTINVNETGLLNVGGSWINSGTFIPGSGIVNFTGPGPRNIRGGVLPDNYVPGYVLSSFTQGMTAISGGSAGPAGDNAHSDVNIGFIFKYLGVNYSQVRLNTNGWLSFNLTGNDATSDNNILLFNTSAPTTTIAPWWDDLRADGSASVSYKTMGTSPNSIFIAEWKNILAYSSEASTRLNFQVKLYETSGIIEFCYGNVVAGTHNVNEGASIGIKDAIGGPGNYKEAKFGTSNLMIACLRSNQDWPTVNYRFTPALAATQEVFYKMTVSPSASLILERNVIVTGSE